MSGQSSEELTELVQAGYRYALSLTHHHYDAEDLVQQATAHWLVATVQTHYQQNADKRLTKLRP